MILAAVLFLAGLLSLSFGVGMLLPRQPRSYVDGWYERQRATR